MSGILLPGLDHILFGHDIWRDCLNLNVFTGCMQLLRQWYSGQMSENIVLLLLICLANGSLWACKMYTWDSPVDMPNGDLDLALVYP